MISKSFVSLLALVATAPLSYAVPTTIPTAGTVGIYAPNDDTLWIRGNETLVMWDTNDYDDSWEVVIAMFNRDVSPVWLGTVPILASEAHIQVPTDIEAGEYQVQMALVSALDVIWYSGVFLVL